MTRLHLLFSVCVCFSAIQLDLSHTPEPRHILSRHSLPITDLHCGLMGAQARIATASLDQTVKVRQQLTGGGYVSCSVRRAEVVAPPSGLGDSSYLFHQR